jgi:hypothetical protein
VHSFLQHLERAGFDGAPRVLGFDDGGREVLTYIDGDVLADPQWQPGEPGPWPPFAQSDDALVAAANLLRRFHGAAFSFQPVAPVWKQYAWPALLPGEIVCHGDIGRHNTVYRDGVPIAFIDWETIRPNHPLIEFGEAAWKYVPLGDDAYFAMSDFGETPDVARRLAMFAGEYGVTEPAMVLWAIQQAKQRSVEALRYWPITSTEAAAYLDLVAREIHWLAGEAERLVRCLR